MLKMENMKMHGGYKAMYYPSTMKLAQVLKRGHQATPRQISYFHITIIIYKYEEIK
jgi:hypothetical protein